MSANRSVRTISDCPRCGRTHKKLTVKKVRKTKARYATENRQTYQRTFKPHTPDAYAVCPVTKEPIGFDPIKPKEGNSDVKRDRSVTDSGPH
jgi:hypothetical protein